MQINQDLLIKRLLINELQRNIRNQCLHDVQSPMSAISGYLELMDICLNNDRNFQKIERYSSKIQRGINEMSQILGQIRYVENKSFQKEETAENVVSWSRFLDDFCLNATSLATKKNQKIVCSAEGFDCYVKENATLLKLFLYNIIINFLNFTPKNSLVNLISGKIDSNIVIRFISEESSRPASDILNAILNDINLSSTELQTVSETLYVNIMARTMEILNCTIDAEEKDSGGVKISVIFSENLTPAC